MRDKAPLPLAEQLLKLQAKITAQKQEIESLRKSAKKKSLKLIPRPAGQSGRANGYELIKEMRLTHNKPQYHRLSRIVRSYTLRYLNGHKTILKQKVARVDKVIELLMEKYPYLARFDGGWPIRDLCHAASRIRRRLSPSPARPPPARPQFPRLPSQGPSGRLNSTNSRGTFLASSPSFCGNRFDWTSASTFLGIIPGASPSFPSASCNSFGRQLKLSQVDDCPRLFSGSIDQLRVGLPSTDDGLDILQLVSHLILPSIVGVTIRSRNWTANDPFTYFRHLPTLRSLALKGTYPNNAHLRGLFSRLRAAHTIDLSKSDGGAFQALRDVIFRVALESGQVPLLPLTHLMLYRENIADVVSFVSLYHPLSFRSSSSLQFIQLDLSGEGIPPAARALRDLVLNLTIS
ncbi:hypothetical protein B0H16DRAFT_1449650 [Mycena metata]|uniref:Uncharacterized protein n=1 Tax=Mycena metata TaxID=1033252 RepID=A0AAD7K1F5_9AGAR|nr:hypothetical protein B0H16DRAFT_1449650 [Mycena metata]